MDKIIFLEFNELCPSLIDQWIAEGKLPNFQRLRDQCAKFTTQADELEAPNLEPWIQWYSLHTGLPFAEHGVFRLADGPRQQHDDVWRILLRAGKRVGSMASMNVRRFDAAGSFFVADPWCSFQPPSPADIAIYQSFVAAQVQEYTKREKLSLATATRFLGFMLTHGLSLRTLTTFARQLVAEKISSSDLTWRRATLLDRLQLDVFRHLVRRYNPHFASFFVNSTAHLQHSYWREMSPDVFIVKPSETQLVSYSDAILFGYQQMDVLLGEFMGMAAGCGGRIVFATALSQQPYLDAEQRGGQHYYRPRDIRSFLRSLEITADHVEPIMTNQYKLRFADKAGADLAADRLKRIVWQERSALDVVRDSAEQLTFGVALHCPIEESDAIVLNEGKRQIGFYDLFYKLEVMKSGRHHPDGCLWIQGLEKPEAGIEKIPILDILPTILDLLDVPTPPKLRGRSLVSRPMVADGPVPAAAALA